MCDAFRKQIQGDITLFDLNLRRRLTIIAANNFSLDDLLRRVNESLVTFPASVKNHSFHETY